METNLVLALLIVSALVSVIYPSLSEPQTKMVLVLMVGVIGLFGLGVVWALFYNNRLKWKKLKALKMADVDNMSGVGFEKYVANLFKDRGYFIQTTPTSGDYGADLVVAKGKYKIVIQTKRYSNKVGIEAVQQVVGAKAYYKAHKALVVTNSYFSQAAKNLAKSNNCVLVDRDLLSKWIWEFSKLNVE